jgi:hypothetical protein
VVIKRIASKKRQNPTVIIEEGANKKEEIKGRNKRKK